MSFVPNVFSSQYKTKRSFDWLTILSCLLMIMFLALRDVYGTPVSKYLFVALCIPIFLLQSRSSIIAFLCFLFPLSWGLPGTYIYVLGLFSVLFRMKGKLKFNQFFIPFIIVFMEIVLCIGYPDFSITSAIGYFARIFILFILILDTNEDIDYLHAITMFVVGTTSFISIIFIATLQEASIEWFLTGHARFGEMREFVDISDDVLALSTNVNYIAYYAILSISCLLLLLSKSKKWRGLLLSILIYTIFIAALTFSRAYILSLGMVLFLYFIYMQRNRNKNFSFIFLSILLLIIGIVYINNNPQYLEKYLGRFGNSRGFEDDSRLIVMKNYFGFLFDHPIRLIFGTGTMSYKYVIGLPTAMHNGTQQILVSYGIVGFSIFIGAIVKAFKLAIRGRLTNLLYFLPLITIVVFIQTIQFLSPHELLLTLIVGIFAIKTAEKQK
jgi:O-antigen ligase